MKGLIAKELSKLTKISISELENFIELPPSPEMGDYSFPCFSLAKSLKKNPSEISLDLSKKINSKEFEKIEAKGPYLNFFINKTSLPNKIIKEISKKREKYGFSNYGKGKKVVIDLSSPNIAKPFGIGHLRSTIIGNALSNIYFSMGYKTIKINYLGDWGTQFGKLIVGYKKFGDKKKLKKEPMKHLLELYIKGNDPEYSDEARQWFKKLEDGDKEALSLWKTFRETSIKDFNKTYSLMNINFDEVSGESFYNKKMDKTISILQEKSLLVKSEDAYGVDLKRYGLGFCLIKKADGATLYATRDITAAIDRYKKYKFSKMIYEVGQEQKLHFQQVFKILELMGYNWSKDCNHVYHGLYLDKNMKKFSTREGKLIFMDDVFNDTISLAKSEIIKREKGKSLNLDKRAKAIAIASIFYGDLRNYRTNDIVFDMDRFVSFEGDTGPYLLYTYARARSILRKAKYSRSIKNAINVSDKEKSLILALGRFPEKIKNAAQNFAPNILANYSFEISQAFNEFYHSEKVVGSENEKFRLLLVDCFSQVLKNSLNLLGIEVIEEM